VSLGDMSDVPRLLTGKKWAKVTLMKIPVKRNTLNRLDYENAYIPDMDGNEFDAWMAPNMTSFRPGPTGGINDKENNTVRINGIKYPWAAEFVIGDILYDSFHNKRWIINGKNDTVEYTNTIRFQVVEDF